MKIFNKLRNLTNKISKKALVAVVLTAAVVGVGASAAVAEFYPNRPTYDYNDLAQRVGSMDGPVFNSFINTPSYGDERPFLDARRSDQTAAGSYKNVLPDVTGGSKEVVLRTYVHNNANQSTNASGKGIAHNTKVRILLPTAEAESLRARSYITADNAASVEDTVDFIDTKAFKVEYIPGSAIMYNGGPLNGAKLNDSIVTSGAQIGYDALNGNLPGCFDYATVVQIRIKVTPKEVPQAKFVKEVRKSGEKDWKKEVKTKPGDTVEWLLTTQNTGKAVLNNAVVRDVLPPHVKLEAGSVKAITSQGTTTQNDKPLFDGGINAGNYAPGGGFYIMFSTKVLGDFDPCEIRVRNQGFMKSQQTPEVKDDADVIITRENCNPTPPKPVYSCDLLQVTALGGRKYSYKVTYTAKDGAKLVSYKYDFGDGTTPLLTDKNPVEYTYQKDGNFVARVTLTFDVNGKQVVVDSDKCAAPIKITPNKPVCPIPGKQNLPPDSPDCKEVPVTPPVAPTGKLPDTGPGEVVAVFAAVSLAGAMAYRVFMARKLSR